MGTSNVTLTMTQEQADLIIRSLQDQHDLVRYGFVRWVDQCEEVTALERDKVASDVHTFMVQVEEQITAQRG